MQITQYTSGLSKCLNQTTCLLNEHAEHSVQQTMSSNLGLLFHKVASQSSTSRFGGLEMFHSVVGFPAGRVSKMEYVISL
ncbi:unnamed protein product [Urochloa humidicola]